MLVQLDLGLGLSRGLSQARAEAGLGPARGLGLGIKLGLQMKLGLGSELGAWVEPGAAAGSGSRVWGGAGAWTGAGTGIKYTVLRGVCPNQSFARGLCVWAGAELSEHWNANSQNGNASCTFAKISTSIFNPGCLFDTTHPREKLTAQTCEYLCQFWRVIRRGRSLVRFGTSKSKAHESLGRGADRCSRAV